MLRNIRGLLGAYEGLKEETGQLEQDADMSLLGAYEGLKAGCLRGFRPHPRGFIRCL